MSINRRVILVAGVVVVAMATAAIIRFLTPSMEQPRVNLELEVPTEATIGQVFPLRLHVRNTSGQKIDFRLSGKPAHEFLLISSQGNVVWNSKGVVLDMYEIKSLENGQEFELETNVYENASLSPSISPGKYEVQGILNLSEPRRQMRSKTQAIEIH